MFVSIGTRFAATSPSWGEFVTCSNRFVPKSASVRRWPDRACHTVPMTRLPQTSWNPTRRPSPSPASTAAWCTRGPSSCQTLYRSAHEKTCPCHCVGRRHATGRSHAGAQVQPRVRVRVPQVCVVAPQPYRVAYNASACGSIWPVAVPPENQRVLIGGPDCRKPYSASLLNISGTAPVP